MTVLDERYRHRLCSDQRERLPLDDEFVHDRVQESLPLQRVERLEEIRERTESAVLEEESMNVRVSEVREGGRVGGRIDLNRNPFSQRIWLQVFQAKFFVEFAQLKHESSIRDKRRAVLRSVPFCQLN